MRRILKFTVPALLGIVLAIVIFVTLFQNRGERGAINEKVGGVAFNFVTWEVEVLFQKMTMWLTGAEYYIPADQQPDLVRDTIKQIEEIKRLEQRVNELYSASDPSFPPSSLPSSLSDKAIQVQEQEQALADARSRANRLQPLAEEILQNQVGAILEKEGFNRQLPPIQMHISPLPQMLIISPRDDIRQLYAFPLEHGLPIVEKEQIEHAVFEENNVSALVESIGGLAVYPTMIIETTNLNFIANTIAHEWAHIWLIPRPLGYRYPLDPNIRTANETTASIFGNEIGGMVIQTYYPERVEVEKGDRSRAKSEPTTFDFRVEMRVTRVEVDRLLAEGEIESAESYMETRRQLFVENGYNIRKLNQAYFAFHGAYAAGGGGAAGSDPIGENVTLIRTRSNSLKQFIRTMSRISNADDLEALVSQ